MVKSAIFKHIYLPIPSPGQADLVSPFWGTLGLLKGKMNREQNILEITKSPNALDNF